MAEIISIAVILLFGTIFSAIAYKLKVSNVFFLVLTGMVMGLFGFADFSNEMIITISELTLIMVVFDSTSKFDIKNVMRYSRESIKLTLVFLGLVLLILTPLTMYFFDINPNMSLVIALLFSALMYGIDPAVSLAVLKEKKDRVINVLDIEAIINTPLTLILSMVMIDMIKGGTADLSGQFVMFLQQFFVAIGVGIVFGYFVVHVMKKNFFQELSHLMVITSAIMVYVLSDVMSGSGVLGVTTFGLIFGNHRIKHKIELEKFASVFANTLEILVFILLGTVIVKYSQYRTFEELLIGSALFIIYLIIRYIAIVMSIKGINFRKKLFMTLNVPKGIDVAVVILIIISSISNVEGMNAIRNISLLFVLYSIVLSTVASLFNDWFFGKEHKGAAK
ncbi:MAG: cation:proton antiporter [Nanobdellota archaeon]